MFKIIGATMVACVLNIIIKEYRREYSVLISVCSVGFVLSLIIPKINDIVSKIGDISSRLGVEGEYILLAMKIVGISYLTAVVCEMCRDSGEGAMAVNMEFAGKIMLTAISVPVIGELIGIVEKILP